MSSIDIVVNIYKQMADDEKKELLTRLSEVAIADGTVKMLTSPTSVTTARIPSDASESSDAGSDASAPCGTAAVAVVVLDEHTDAVGAVAFAPSGKFLASGSDDTTVRIWDVDAKRCVQTLKKHDAAVTTVAFAQEGGLFAAGSADGAVSHSLVLSPKPYPSSQVSSARYLMRSRER